MGNFKSDFSFVLPTKIVFGHGVSKNLLWELKELGARRPLIVTDKGIISSGVLGNVLAHLPIDMSHHVFDGVASNPKDINVSAGTGAYRAAGADSIIAIGGGSPMDCAKAIGVLVANDASDIKAFEGRNIPSNPLPPLICVPTTSGTASELTFSSVITNTKERYKMTIRNSFTAPNTAVCDPELTMTVPPAVTASTGLDALTHAIEAYTATCSEPISDAVALYAIELIYQNLLPAFENGMNMEARSNMLMGSMLAGIAFSHSDVASVHCISEALGGLCDLPHGTCIGIFLPYLMEYNMDYCEKQYARIAKAMGLSYGSEREGAAAAVAAVKQLTVDLKLPHFSSLNVDPADYDKLALDALKNLSTPSNPRPMDKSDYIEVLKMAQGG
jgi:alcohol dehydrogenase